MAGQLIPPPELAPTIPRGSTSQQRVEMWVDLVNACDQLLQAGLRYKIGPEGDFEAAYRDWYNRQADEHDRMILHMLQELANRERNQAR